LLSSVLICFECVKLDETSIVWNLSFDAGTGLGAFMVGAIATATSYSVAFTVLAFAAGVVGGCWALPRPTRRSD
jgi:hypothetical protein